MDPVAASYSESEDGVETGGGCGQSRDLSLGVR